VGDRPRVLLLLDQAAPVDPALHALELVRASAQGVGPEVVGVVVRWGGPVSSLLAELVPVVELSSAGARWTRADALEEALRRSPARGLADRGLVWRVDRALAKVGPVDRAVAVGLGAVPLAAALPAGVPLAAVAHERGLAVQRLPTGVLAALRERDATVVAPSPLVADELAAWGVPGHDLQISAACVAPGGPEGPGTGASVARPASAVEVRGVGDCSWAAGADLFLQLVRHLPAEVDGQPVVLRWSGAPLEPGRSRLAHDLRCAGWEQRLAFDDGCPAESALDAGVVVVPAREVALPVRAARARVAGIPVVAFEGSGAGDALGVDGGPPLDVVTLRARMLAALEGGSDEAVDPTPLVLTAAAPVFGGGAR